MERPLDWRWIEKNLLPHTEEIQRRIRSWIHREIDVGDSQDVVQNAWLRLVLGHFDLADVRDPQALLYTVSRNLVIDEIRRIRAFPISSFETLDELPSPCPGPDVEAADTQELKAVMRAIEDLPPAWRQTLVLRRLKGLSQVETSRHLMITEATVENHVKRSRNRLRQICEGRIRDE